MLIKDAPLVRKYLNGIVCVYKPPMVSWQTVKKTLLSKLSRELNEMECRPQRPYINITGDTGKELRVDVSPSYADHPLAIGPRYIPKEMKASPLLHLNCLMSGVCVIGLNEGIKTVTYLKKCNPLSTFRVVGQLGIITNNKIWTGETLYRCNYKHIKRYNIDKAVGVIEANTRKDLFSLSGIHSQSQEAYEMLAKGLFRPVSSTWPLIYSMKCIEVNLPYFTLEIVAANEREQHLIDVIFEIGNRLTNGATTTSIQCTRCAYFSVENTLLKKHWTLQHVLDNIANCQKILANNGQFTEFLRQVQKEERSELIENVDDMSRDEEEEMIKKNM